MGAVFYFVKFKQFLLDFFVLIYMLDNSINNALNVKVESFSDYRRITKNYSSNSFSSPFLGAKSYDFCDIKNQELNYEILKDQF